MKRLRPFTVVLLAILVTLLLVAYDRYARAAQPYGDKEPDVQPPAESPDWKRMGKPQPGEWLAVFSEPGQTFAEYKKQCKNRKTDKLNKMYLVPLGDIAQEEPQLIEKSAQYLGIFFDCDVVTLPAVPLPEEAYTRKRDQYNADRLLDGVVLPMVKEKPDALAMIALANEDMYHGGLNFVFGVASLEDRVGVYSVARFHGVIELKDDSLELLRTIKLASHETGHIFGMYHCTFYECVMNGTNSLTETDRRPAHLCPVCLRKLEWNTGLNALERYKKLEKFFADAKLKEEAEFCKRRIKELEKFRSSAPKTANEKRKTP